MKTIIVADFAINQKFIIKNYCVNKNKPEMKCYGSCHLKKQLKRQDNSENFPSGDSKIKFETEFFSQNIDDLTLTFSQKSNKLTEYFYFKKIKGFSFSVYHPPEFC